MNHYAKANEIDIVNFLPYHLQDGQASFNSKYFFVRTKQILNNADKLLALWDTHSKGTEYAIKYAQKLGIPVKVVKIPKQLVPKTIGDIGKTASNVKPSYYLFNHF